MTQPAVRPALDRALADLLLRDVGLPLIAHLIGLGLVLLLVWDVLPMTVFIPWAAAVSAAVAARAVLSHRARRLRTPPSAVARSTRLALIAVGLAWGIGTGVAAQYLPIATISLVLLALAGLVGGSVATLAPDRWAFPLYSAAVFTPLLVGVALAEQGRTEAVTIAFVVVFVAFTIRLHRQAHESIVERLHREAEVRDRERQLASAQAIAHVGSWEWDFATNAVTWSDELRRMYGVGMAAPAGYAEFLALAHPDDRARLEALVAEGVRTHRAIDYEWRAVRPDGEVRHILGRNVVVTDGDGRPVRMAGTSLDVTERKRAEENQQTLLRELQQALAEVKTLQGILPICASCKRIRGENGAWEAVESYMRDHTNAEFSHGLCPDCAKKTWG